MKQLDRIYKLYQAIRARRYPVPMAVLRDRLECSESTVKRAIRDLRLLDAPLDYDRERGGYFFNHRGDAPYELPGLWFNSEELRALLAVHQLLEELHSDFLQSHLAPLRARIETLLARGAGGGNNLVRRVRVPHIGARGIDADLFRSVASALFSRRKLRVAYHARASGDTTERALSPQRLVYYRNNWYLDAWCHLRRGLRSFSLDRLRVIRGTDQPAKEIDDARLDAIVRGSYGIYAGKAQQRARILFSLAAASWVAAEQWHPQQRGAFTARGYELEIPYNNPTELVMDILRHGAEAEVLAPPELRRMVGQRLRAAAKKY